VKKILLPLFFMFLCSCSKNVVYYNTEPFTSSVKLSCLSSKIDVTVFLRKFEIIKEKKETLYWPTPLQLENDYIFYKQDKVSIKIKVANPYRERIKIELINQHKTKDIQIISSQTLYDGTLPYREYEYFLPMKEGIHEVYFELWVNEKLACPTGRACYTIR